MRLSSPVAATSDKVRSGGLSEAFTPPSSTARLSTLSTTHMMIERASQIAKMPESVHQRRRLPIPSQSPREPYTPTKPISVRETVITYHAISNPFDPRYAEIRQDTPRYEQISPRFRLYRPVLLESKTIVKKSHVPMSCFSC